jgi:predicted nucleic acid-binding protein
MLARVADASVVAAIVFGEPRGKEAERLLSGAALFAPSLLPYELASVAWKKVRERPRQRGQISLALARGLSLTIRYVRVPAANALDVALDSRLSVYDAAYLWLARDIDCALATFDQSLGRAAAATGVSVVRA